MQDILINKLHQYIRENNLDLLLELEEAGKLTEYLTGKVISVESMLQDPGEKQPDYIIEEACMEVLTRGLRPSKYNYIQKIFEEEFTGNYQKLLQSETLQFEIINVIGYCKPLFDEAGFSEENEDSRELHYAITGAITEYLEINSAKET